MPEPADPPATDPKQKEGRLQELAEEGASKFLLGSFAILTAALTAFGVTTGTVDRVERNQSMLFWSGCVLIFVAICLGVIGLTVPAADRYVYFRRNRPSVIGVSLAAIGFLVIIFESLSSLGWFSDYPYLLGGLLVVVGVVLWAVGKVQKPADPVVPVPRPPPSGRPPLDAAARDFFRWGAFAFLIGMGAVLGAIILHAREQPRPSITAKLTTVEGLEHFDSSVKAGGLQSHEHLRVLVEGILPPYQGAEGKAPLNKDKVVFHYRIPLYFTVLGPNASGEVDYNVQLPLARRFESIQVRAWVGEEVENEPDSCFRPAAFAGKIKLPGCLTIRVPVRASLPVLGARWKAPRAKRPTLVVSVDAKDVPLTIPDVSLGLTVLNRPTLMVVRIYGLGSSSSSTEADDELFLSLMSPDRAGTIERSFRIAVPRRFTAVCVAAGPVNPSDQAKSPAAGGRTKPVCAEAGERIVSGDSTVWTYLALPAS
jgi:hypothetical protein